MWIQHMTDLLVLLHRVEQSLIARTLTRAPLGRGTWIDGHRMFVEHGFGQLGQIATQHGVVHGTDVDAQHIALPIAAARPDRGQRSGGVASGDDSQIRSFCATAGQTGVVRVGGWR